MKLKWLLLVLLPIFLTACMQQATEEQQVRLKVGMVLADYGLGDQSFNDTAFLGLIKARNELDILFDYRDLKSSGSYQQAFIELIEEECDLIIGLGFNMIEDMNHIATQFKEQKFLFIDENLELPNVTSITFKEDEGSFLVGLIAGLKTESNSIGFIGGMDVPVINRFKDGFIAGVQAVNPEANVIVDYAHSFGDSEKGRELAHEMIVQHDVDIIYPAAGFSGLGAIEEAAHQNVYALGVDSDQFFVAEKAVITSMLKNIDVAVYTAIERFIENGDLLEGHIELGIEENGVGIAPIRIISLTPEEQEMVESYTEMLIDGVIEIKNGSVIE